MISPSNLINTFTGFQVYVNDLLCIKQELTQYRFPKQKSYRRVKKWRKNRKNWRYEENHYAYQIGNNIYLSQKMYDEIGH